MKTYEEKQLYRLLKQLNKSYMTQKQIIEKYGDYIFRFAVNESYIICKDKRYQPFLNNKGIYEFHDSDRYFIAEHGEIEYKRLHHLNQLEFKSDAFQSVPIAISIFALIIAALSYYHSLKTEQNVKIEITNVIKDKTIGSFSDQGSVHNDLHKNQTNPKQSESST